MSDPIPDLPAPAPAGGGLVSADASLPAAPTPSICGFGIQIPPRFSLKFNLPAIPFPPEIPLPFISWKLSCDLSNPLDVTAGVRPGGGRTSNAPADPDAVGAPP